MCSRSVAEGEREGRTRPALGWLFLIAAAGLVVGLALLGHVASESALADALTHDTEFTVTKPAIMDAESLGGFRSTVARQVARLNGDLGLITTDVVSPAFSIVDVNGAPPAGDLGHRSLVATYVDHLGSHVDVTGGGLPPDGLGGGEAPVTIEQRTADLLGLHLNDHLCLGTTGAPAGAQVSCVRVVGLWRRHDAADAFWAGEALPASLTMPRYDLFELVKSLHAPGALGTMRFQPDPALVTQPGAAGLAGRVATLDRQLRAAGYTVSTRLDRALAEYAASSGAALFGVGLSWWTAIVLGLLALGVSAGRFAVPPEMTVSRDLRILAFAVLVIAGTPLLASWRLGLRPEDTTLGSALGTLVPVLGSMLLAAGVVCIYPLLSRLSIGRRGGLQEALAVQQLERAPDQHAAAVLLMVLTAAAVVLWAAGVAATFSPGSLGSAPPQIRLSFGLSALAGFAAALILGLAGLAIHFIHVAKDRIREYGGLFADGPPAGLLASSLAVEQRPLERWGLAAGALVGWILVLAVLPALRLSGGAIVAGIILQIGMLPILLSGLSGVRRLVLIAARG